MTNAYAVQDTLELQGIVEELTTISFAEIGNTNLNLDLKNIYARNVANLEVYSNAASGFSVSFSSLNGNDVLTDGSQGVVRDIATSNFVKYSLTVGSTTVLGEVAENITGGVIEITSFPVNFYSHAQTNGASSGFENLPSGTYIDTVTAILSVNI